MATVRLFNAKIVDECGGEFPQAFVAIRAASKSAQETFTNTQCEGEYSIETTLEAISYKVNYWYSPTTKAAGYPSRPLLSYDDGEFSDTFTVDVEHPETKEILSGSREPSVMMFDAIQADIIRKFK